MNEHEAKAMQSKTAALEIQVSDLSRALKEVSKEKAQIEKDLDSLKKKVNCQNTSSWSSEFKVPEYSNNYITPQSYLSEIEQLFTWRNAHPDSWIMFVPKFFDPDSDLSRWWSATRTTAKSWDQFKAEFLRYESNNLSYDSLCEKLFLRKQRLDEPFESFAWDIYSDFLKIDPKINQKTVIDRILHACLPEISVLVQRTVASVADLVIHAREVIADLNRVRRIERKPLLLVRKGDSISISSTKGNFQGSQTSQLRQNGQHSNMHNMHQQTQGNIHNGSHQHTFRQNFLSHKQVGNSNTHSANNSTQASKFCSYHNSNTHNTNECRQKARLAQSSSNQTNSTPSNSSYGNSGN